MDMDIDIKEIENNIRAARIANNSTDPINLEEVNTLMRILRQYLSCEVCHKLPDRKNLQFDGFICPECINNNQTIEYTSISALKRCFKSLCDCVRISPLYSIICANDEDERTVELGTEVFTVSHPIKDHNLLNGVSNKPKTEVKDGHYNVDVNSSSNVQLLKNNEKTDYSNLQLSDMHKRRIRTALNTVPNKKMKTERRGCRCGSATSTPGKLTCFGKRCPCYTEQKPCDTRCKCRGCRNPKLKSSNNDDDLEMDKKWKWGNNC